MVTDTGHMPFSLAIVAVVVLWTWLLATRVPNRAVLVVGAAVIALAVWHNLRRGEWGVAWHALGGASRGAILFTLSGVGLILGAGWALGTLHDPSGPVLAAMLYRGEIPRGEVPRTLDVSERTANRVVADLVERGVLTSQTPKAPLRITFPATLASYWMPGLFPEQRE